MGLRTRCPKCESDVRDGARRCPMCGTPLSITAFEPPEALEGAPVIDPLLSLFERDEPVRTCPACWNEFAWNVKSCSGCERTIRVVPRSTVDAALRRRPIHDAGVVIARGPDDTPRDLVRVRTCADADEVQAWAKEFRFMGVRPWIGTDTLDVDPDPARVGLYVRPDDVGSARYLLSGKSPVTEDPRRAPAPTTPKERALAESRAYHAIGKYLRAVACVEGFRGDADAEDAATEAMLAAGRVRDAERRAETAAEAAPPGLTRGRLRSRAGAVAALGHDGSPFGAGARPEVARLRLEQAVSDAPRLLEAGKALVEVDLILRDGAAALAELRRIARVNPNIVATDGWFRDRYEELRIPG